MSLTLFDSSKEQLACISDSIDSSTIRIWNCKTGELVSSYASSFQVTCCTWLKPKASRKKKRGIVCDKELAFGAANGEVSILDVESGIVSKTINKLSSPVRDIVFDDNGSIYAASLNGDILKWSLNEEESFSQWKTKIANISRIMLSESSDELFIATNLISLYNLQTKKVKKFGEHSSIISNISGTRNVITASEEDRFINFWDLETKELIKSVNIDSQIDFMTAIEDDFLCLSTDGILFVFREDKQFRVKFVDDREKIIPIIHAEFKGKGILTCRGSSIVPVIEFVPFSDADIVLQRTAVDLQPETDKSRKNEKSKVSVLNFADFKISSTQPEKFMEGDTMGDKVSLPEINDSSTTTTTLFNMLNQALRTGDKALLETCFSNSQAEVINSTVKKISPVYILALLDQLVLRFQKKPSRGNNLLMWIKSVLAIHSAYLMNVPKLSSRISPLYKVMESRAGILPKLLKLSGRLELVVSQAELRSMRQKESNSTTIYEYEDRSDESESSEDSESEMETEDSAVSDDSLEEMEE